MDLMQLIFFSIPPVFLQMLPSHQLSKLANLTNLSLGGNTFVQVPPVAFSGLQNLRELRLDRLMNLTTIGSR